MGHCGRSERAAALTSRHEYDLLRQAWEERQRERYRLARWICWQLNMAHYKRGQAPRTPEQYYSFAWEDAERAEEIKSKIKTIGTATAEEAAQLDELIKLTMHDDEQAG